MSDKRPAIGVVVIGRNEGDRLVRCLASLDDDADRVVYVDSGSTDRSVEHARSVGVDVVELDMSKPFTMARGRNTGFEWLRELAPEIALVQFIDGDCELASGWVERAVEVMGGDESLGVVFGRRRERSPDASIYNRLTDMEWRGPPGEVSSCGGDAMIRAEAITAVGGYNAALIAGEEPEMCIRLRAAGWGIRRIDEEMTLHDAAMTRFGQWWRRMKRGGHAAAELATMHGAGAAGAYVHSALSALWWGGCVPALAVVGVIVASLVSPAWAWAVLVFVLGYGVLAIRVVRSRRRIGDGWADARLYAFFCVIGKPAMCQGVMTYWLNRLCGRRSTLIEYKGALMSGEASSTESVTPPTEVQARS